MERNNYEERKGGNIYHLRDHFIFSQQEQLKSFHMRIV